MSCHSENVTKVFVNYSENPVGSVIVIDGKCYIKTGIEGTLTHQLSSAPVVISSCTTCLSGLSGGES